MVHFTQYPCALYVSGFAAQQGQYWSMTTAAATDSTGIDEVDAPPIQLCLSPNHRRYKVSGWAGI